ncbi:hypothetical protein ACLOJK_006467 [Asimina triloba]
MDACVAQMEKPCASLPSGISVCYNLTWPTVSLMKDGVLGDLRFGLAAGQVVKTGRWVSTWGAAAACWTFWVRMAKEDAEASCWSMGFESAGFDDC